MTEQILQTISSLEKPDEGYVFRQVNDVFWGKDSEDNVVFGMVSQDDSRTLIESTKHLKLLLNVLCQVEKNDKKYNENLNILILNNNNQLELFISLSNIFAKEREKHSFLEFFLFLKNLFTNAKSVSINELQGKFGELYVMYYFKTVLEVDISNFYQTENKLKFDFSISEEKKLEIKTTLKQERVHRFRNEQLNSLRYDIKIVSILLQKDDRGLSLYELVERCKLLFNDNFITMLNIEKMIYNIETQILKDIKFNEQYLLDNIKIFDAVDIPRIREKTDEGIFNIEYDSNLTGIKYCDVIKLIEWLG